jgi:hypothetical protein
MHGAARAQSTEALMSRLARHTQANIDAAKEAAAAGDCKKFEQEVSDAQERIDDMRRLLESHPDEGTQAGNLAAQLGPVVEEGCPKGTGFKPKTDLGLHFKREFDPLRTRALAAQKANDCIARDARIVDLRILREHIEYFDNRHSVDDEAVHIELARFKHRIDRLIAELKGGPCPPQIVLRPKTASVLPAPKKDPCHDWGLSRIRIPRTFYAAPDPEAARRARLRSEAEKAFAFVDELPRQVLIECVFTEISVGAESIDFPHTSYLGSSIGGVDHLGLVKVDDYMRGWSADWNTQIHFGNASPLAGGFVEFGVTRGWAEEHTFAGSFDPGPGARLAIPGPNGGTSGFSIAPGNAATNLQYSAGLRELGLRLGYGKPFQVTANTQITPKLFATYTRSDFNESMAGSIPGVGRDFRYSTDIGIDRFSFGLGLAGETHIDTPLADSGWDVALRYAGEFSGFKIAGSGHDSLDFTGFPTSTQALDKNETDWGFKLSTGIELKNRYGLTFAIEGAYERRPGSPEVVRDGVNPSMLQLNYGSIWTAKGIIRFEFDAHGRLTSYPVDEDDFY